MEKKTIKTIWIKLEEKKSKKNEIINFFKLSQLKKISIKK